MSIVKLEPFENVAAGARAVLKTSRILGNTVERIMLKLGGTAFTKAQINLLRVKLNQKTVWEVTGARLDAMNQYLGYGASAVHLPLWFSEPRARTIAGQMLGSIDTSLGIRDFTIEVDIDAGATAPTLEAWADIAPPKLLSPAENPLIRGLLLTTLTPNSAADHTLQVNTGNAAGALLKRLFTFHTNMTRFRVKRDGVDIYEDLLNADAEYTDEELGHVWQAGLYVANFVRDDNQSKALTTRRPDGTPVNHQFIFTTSAGDTMFVLADIYAPLALL